jgi:hypothetical protein
VFSWPLEKRNAKKSNCWAELGHRSWVDRLIAAKAEFQIEILALLAEECEFTRVIKAK